MSPHLIESAAKAQIDDRLRHARRRRVAAEARVRRSASVPQPSRPHLGLRVRRWRCAPQI